MVSRMVLVAAVAALACLAAQVEAAPRDPKWFIFDIEKKDKEEATALPCVDDTTCAATNGYCKNFGGLTGLRCVNKRANGKKCDRPAMCQSGKCPSICLIWDSEKCIQKCEA